MAHSLPQARVGTTASKDREQSSQTMTMSPLSLRRHPSRLWCLASSDLMVDSWSVGTPISVRLSQALSHAVNALCPILLLLLTLALVVCRGWIVEYSNM